MPDYLFNGRMWQLELIGSLNPASLFYFHRMTSLIITSLLHEDDLIRFAAASRINNDVNIKFSPQISSVFILPGDNTIITLTTTVQMQLFLDKHPR